MVVLGRYQRGFSITILVVNGLSDGLSEAAIDAARRIKFTPAKLNGRAVSMYMEVHYNFNLY